MTSTQDPNAKSMRAVVISQPGPPDVLKVNVIPIPSIEKDEVLVRVKYAGVNPVDTYLRSGNFPNSPKCPYTPGKDGAGHVASIGSDVETVKEGDTVFFCSLFGRSSQGSYGEYAVVQKGDVWSIPGDSKLDSAAGLGIPYMTAHRALFLKGGAKKDDIILVHGGSGAVGQAAIQMAVHHGMRVLATAGSDAGIALLKELGADAFDHRDKGYFGQILKKYPNKVDIILEMRADINLDKDTQLAAKNGRILVIGNRGSTQIDARHIMFPEASIIGVAAFASTADEWQESASYVKSGFISGYLKPKIVQIYKMDEAPQSHIDVIENTGGAQGKRVIEIV